MRNNSLAKFQLVACKKCCSDSIMIIKCFNEIVLCSDNATDEDKEVISKLLDQIQDGITRYYVTLHNNRVYKVPEEGALGILFQAVLEVTLRAEFNRSVFDVKVFAAHDTLTSLLLYLKDQIREFHENMPDNQYEDVDVILTKL
ncbi:MAG: hypothetical protein ACRC13_11525 [Tannerellaceae bacterium]